MKLNNHPNHPRDGEFTQEAIPHDRTSAEPAITKVTAAVRSHGDQTLNSLNTFMNSLPPLRGRDK